MMNADQQAYLTGETPTEHKELLLNCMASGPNRLAKEEIQFISERLTVKTFKKGTVLLREGQVSTRCFHNFKGCVRQYYLKDGEEKTIFFYTEGESISATISTESKRPANYYLECVEDTVLGAMTHQQEQELFRKFPRFEKLSRMETEKKLDEYQDMLATFILSTPEERYLNLLQRRPDLLHRVPQYQLASYLGIKPESLSRIRKRISSR